MRRLSFDLMKAMINAGLVDVSKGWRRVDRVDWSERRHCVKTRFSVFRTGHCWRRKSIWLRCCCIIVRHFRFVFLLIRTILTFSFYISHIRFLNSKISKQLELCVFRFVSLLNLYVVVIKKKANNNKLKFHFINSAC